MATLSDDLEAIERHLALLERKVLLRAFQPGLGADVVRKAMKSIALTSTSEIEAVYAWHNGVGPEGEKIGNIVLFPGFYLTSLDETIANYRAFVVSERWKQGWFPLLANGGGDFLVVDLSDDGRVRRFDISVDGHDLEYESLSALFATVRAGFDQKLFFLDNENYLDMNPHVFRALAARLNPTIDWWKD